MPGMTGYELLKKIKVQILYHNSFSHAFVYNNVGEI
jgi:CheY-like chemotaxis protein